MEQVVMQRFLYNMQNLLIKTFYVIPKYNILKNLEI